MIDPDKDICHIDADELEAIAKKNNEIKGLNNDLTDAKVAIETAEKYLKMAENKNKKEFLAKLEKARKEEGRINKEIYDANIELDKLKKNA